MDLVTVACLRDLEAQRLQSASIKYVTNPTRHWVVINEANPDLEFWHDQLSPYYTGGHRLMLKAGAQNPHSINGWINHQWLKFNMALELDSPYMLLDSKNLFIKSVDLRQWLTIQGSGGLTHYDRHQPDRYTMTIKKYSKLIGVEPANYQWINETPWVVDPQVVKELMAIKPGWDQWFVEPDHGPSEFLLYCIWQQAQGRWHAPTHPPHQRLHESYWPGSEPMHTRELAYIDANHKIRMIGLHRLYLAEQTNAGLTALYGWLRYRGLPTGVVDEQNARR